MNVLNEMIVYVVVIGVGLVGVWFDVVGDVGDFVIEVCNLIKCYGCNIIY